MGIIDRKNREKEEMRSLIVNTAGEIIKEEGIDNLSIRKIAARIEYSPAIIYHYFQDKDEIINLLMRDGYMKILRELSGVRTSPTDPEERLRELIRRYIDMALKMPDEYTAVLLNSAPSVTEHTSALFKGASQSRQALGMLSACVKDMHNGVAISELEVELDSQIIWTSTFGLIIRLIIEKDLPEEQKENLIAHHIKFVLRSVSNNIK